MAKPLFPANEPMPADQGKYNPKGRSNNQGQPLGVVEQRYAVYIEEAQSGKHMSQSAALQAAAERVGLKTYGPLQRQFKRFNKPMVELKLPELAVEAPVTVEEQLLAQLAAKDEEIARRDRDLVQIRRIARDYQSQIFAKENEEARLAELVSQRFNAISIPIEKHVPDSPGMLMTEWSDWHWGEEVTAREMGGLNIFNREIGYERAEKLVNGTIKLARNYSGLTAIDPGIWVCLGGDMISGGIHEELRETNWGTIEEQAYEVGQVLLSCLLAMADEFGHVYVPCVVGNHGRHSLKPVAKRHVRENREWGIYKALEAQLAGDDRFDFYIPDTPDFHFDVYGHRFMLTHGNQIGAKGGDGHIGAVGPITRGTMKTYRAKSQIDLGFDTMIEGHWHAYQPCGVLVPTITNGTFKGFDEYAMNVLRVPYSPPVQALWYVSPKHGIVNQTPVDLR